MMGFIWEAFVRIDRELRPAEIGLGCLISNRLDDHQSAQKVPIAPPKSKGAR
jgi:hypothetical protein